ncbi:MAG TPA: fibronectin type III domain-containing protein, partial [Pseudonocardiaceae bacterium]|nr:fibronectin type III domain-containing protein [Pseudonocardiaceae bacterium]
TGPAPQVSTGGATAASPTSETLAGTVDPEGSATSYVFQYGTGPSYGFQSASVSAGAGTAAVSASATLTGLNPNTTYHYRLEATNANGTTDGADGTFTTPALAPTPPPSTGSAPSATTATATKVGEISALLRGSVAPGGLASTYHFQYGTSTTYGAQTADASAGSGTTSTAVSAPLSKLKPNTTYHYRLIVTNADGTSTGADMTFHTAPILAVSFRIPKAITLSKGRFPVTVNCSAACLISATLGISAVQARALHLPRTAVTLAKASSGLRRTGRATVTFRLSAAAQKAIAHSRGVKVRLQLSVAPAVSGPSRTFNRTVVLRR